jgi:hypothetical protein
MADIRIRFGSVMGSGAPVYSPVPAASQKITSSGTSQQSTYSADDGDFVSVFALGGAVAIAIGPNPTAVGTSGDVVGSGGTRDFGPLKQGDYIAIVDVS